MTPTTAAVTSESTEPTTLLPWVLLMNGPPMNMKKKQGKNVYHTVAINPTVPHPMDAWKCSKAAIKPTKPTTMIKGPGVVSAQLNAIWDN
jgi:hypothetical protein